MENQLDISSLSNIFSELIRRSQVLWTEQSAYSFKVEKLVDTIHGITDTFSRLKEQGDRPSLAAEIIQSVCIDQYMGNLHRVVESNIGFENMVSLTTATAEMFVSVSPTVLDVELLQAPINMALKCIEGYKVAEIENKINCSPSNGQPDAIKHHPDNEGNGSQCVLIKHNCVSFLNVVFNSASDVLSRILLSSPEYDCEVLHILLAALRTLPISLCYQITGSLLTSLVDRSSTPPKMAETIWKFICSVWLNKTTVESNSTDLVLTLLCCLHHLFIRSSPLFASYSVPVRDYSPLSVTLVDVCLNDTFWKIVQSGLTDPDPLSRKRGMFLLHKALCSVEIVSTKSGKTGNSEDRGGRDVGVGHSEGCVFWWGCANEEEHLKLQSVWEGVVLLLETLEEKQVHIVKPVLNQLGNIMSATRRSVDGHCLLHLSWVMVVLKRVFSHDAKSVVKLGIISCLEMKLDNSPLLLKENWDLFFDPLVSILKEAYVFARENHDTGQNSVYPIIAEKLVRFLNEIMKNLSLELRGSFLKYLLNCLSSKTIPDLPMVYVSYALSCMESSSPGLLKSDSLPAMRSLVMNSLSTHRAILRSATQCFLLKCFCQNADTGLDFIEIFHALGCFSVRECLTFGSSAWQDVSEYIYRAVSARELSSFSIFRFLQSHLLALIHSKSQSLAPSISLGPTVLGRAILLALTAEIKASFLNQPSLSIGQSVEEVVSTLLVPLAEIVGGARTRAYIDHDCLTSAVELLSSVFQLLLDGKELLEAGKINKGLSQTLYKVLSPWLPDVLLFLLDGLFQGSKSTDSSIPSLEHVQLYRTSLNCVFTIMDKNGYQWNGSKDFSLSSIARRAMNNLLMFQSSHVILTSSTLGSVSALEWVCELQRRKMDGKDPLSNNNQELLELLIQMPVNLSLSKPEEEGTALDKSGPCVEYGPIIDYFLTAYWRCVLFGLEYSTDSHVIPLLQSHDDHMTKINSKNPETIAELCIEYIDIAMNDIATPILCFSVLVPKLSLTLCVSYVNSIWPLVKGLKHDLKQLLDCISAFLHAAFHPHLMISDDADVIEMQTKIVSDIEVMAESKVGVFNLLMSHLCGQWQTLLSISDDPSVVLRSISNRHKALIGACTFGPVFKKNLRVIIDVELFVKSLGDNCFSNAITMRDPGTDCEVRVRVLLFLMELGSPDKHSTGVRTLICDLIVQLSTLLKRTAEEKPRYYINSFTHRYRLRLVQTLLLLHHFMDESTAEEVVMVMWECLENDNQLSVRFSIEWLIVLLYHCHSIIWKNTLLPQLNQKTCRGKRLSRLCSVFTVTIQYGKCLESIFDKCDYYSQVLPLVFQWGLCHHFVVRLYAVGSVLEMWKECSDLLQKTPQLSLYFQHIEFIKQHSDVVKSKKLDMNVFFTHIHPLHDFSVETVFHLLPALTGVIEEEWIAVKTFLSTSPHLYSTGFSQLSLKCTNQKIHALFDECLSTSTKEDCAQFVQQFDPNDDSELPSDCINDVGDVQKKITPWSNSNAILGELFPGIHLVEKKGSSSGLILVASLLLKPPNIGGLCRTCEIFGVSEVVLGSKSVLDEKEFKSLSVTSEKWINITEVKPLHLKDYLLSMRKKGYSLVGVEQTAHSKCISSYKFPPKTVLLLGNERQGIPVELIHLLSDCVEIPQFGTIRSLNVHVSGALIVWEYTKQHLMNSL